MNVYLVEFMNMYGSNFYRFVSAYSNEELAAKNIEYCNEHSFIDVKKVELMVNGNGNKLPC